MGLPVRRYGSQMFELVSLEVSCRNSECPSHFPLKPPSRSARLPRAVRTSPDSTARAHASSLLHTAGTRPLDRVHGHASPGCFLLIVPRPSPGRRASLPFATSSRAPFLLTLFMPQPQTRSVRSSPALPNVPPSSSPLFSLARLSAPRAGACRVCRECTTLSSCSRALCSRTQCVSRRFRHEDRSGRFRRPK
ncbi:hypothetical protein BD413DRAFT_164815 [Trametes elegans]|nr:hypothetical protein BD413DRAFT_164815 [Trametes elegans]